jgi:hypothetical protein
LVNPVWVHTTSAGFDVGLLQMTVASAVLAIAKIAVAITAVVTNVLGHTIIS